MRNVFIKKKTRVNICSFESFLSRSEDGELSVKTSSNETKVCYLFVLKTEVEKHMWAKACAYKQRGK